MSGLTDREITRIINRYVGVSGGYLGDFSYRSHADFYPEYCDMEIDPHAYEETTRERFIAILGSTATSASRWRSSTARSAASAGADGAGGHDLA